MHYHIVGIGGAGMSAIAHILLDQGHVVSGSDMQRSALAAALERRGVQVFIGHDPGHVADADALITTSAAKPEHVEIQAAHTNGIAVLKRADLWREWSRQRRVVAVAGTAGKTTTTALLATILTHAGLNPGFLVGGEVPDLGANARWGDPNAPLVIEADEYDRTFLALTPDVAIITNVEWDHVDIYGSPADYEAAFREFATSVADPRRLIVCGDDPGALRVAEHPRVTQYGIEEAVARDPASCRLAPLDWMAANVRSSAEGTSFDIWRYDHTTFATRLLGQHHTGLAGDHNVRNALAAIAAATTLGVAPEAIRVAIEAYHGTRRRFELKGEVGGVTIIDDYAHHPSKVRATLAAARQRYPGRRLVVYAQPHTYSRTLALLDDWAIAFAEADCVRIGDIYAAREANSLGTTAGDLVARIEHRDVRAAGGIEQSAALLAGELQPGDLLLTLGAGDSDRVGELVLAQLKAANTGSGLP